MFRGRLWAGIWGFVAKVGGQEGVVDSVGGSGDDSGDGRWVGAPDAVVKRLTFDVHADDPRLVGHEGGHVTTL